MTRQKPHVFLDLDQTIISSEYTSSFPMKQMKPRIKHMTYHEMDDEYLVFERPGLQAFLDFLFRHFQVSVWTAASKSYALFIIEHCILIKPERSLYLMLFFEHTVISKRRFSCPKKLELLWSAFHRTEFNQKNTWLIDDLKENCDSQMAQCICIHPFHILEEDSEKDKELIRVSQLLKQRLLQYYEYI